MTFRQKSEPLSMYIEWIQLITRLIFDIDVPPEKWTPFDVYRISAPYEMTLVLFDIDLPPEIWTPLDIYWMSTAYEMTRLIFDIWHEEGFSYLKIKMFIVTKAMKGTTKFIVNPVHDHTLHHSWKQNYSWNICLQQSRFCQTKEIFISLDELDRMAHVWIGFNYSLTQAQKTFHCRG